MKPRLHLHLHLPVALALLTPCACPMDDDDDGDDGDDVAMDEGGDTLATSDDAGSSSSTAGAAESSTGASEASFSVSGVVTRLASAPIAEGNDGIGTLYIGAFASCSNEVGPIGIFAMPAADFSSEDNEVPWQIDGLPPGPVHFGLFLDDNGDAELPTPLPGPGDPTYADDVCDGLLSCIEIEIPEADVTDAALVLDATHTHC